MKDCNLLKGRGELIVYEKENNNAYNYFFYVIDRYSIC